MSAHALLSLRGLKYRDEWQPVWDFLTERHDFPGPLSPDEAIDEVVHTLETNEGIARGLVEPTVLELIGNADQMGLRQDQVARLARIVMPDDQRHLELLEHATANLGWDDSEFHSWEELIGDPGPIDAPSIQRRTDQLVPVSLHRWTTQLSADGLTTMAPFPDTPSCSSTNVSGRSDDGRATTVFGRFDIDATVPDLGYATDPHNWPACSWFFISMIDQGPATPLPPPDAVGSTAYTVPLEELVGMENVLTVNTGLTVRYFVANDSVGMEFDLTPGTHGDGKIDVDHGFLLAERHPTQPGKLVVTSQKTFSFVGLDDLPFSFLCEFGWIDMMRAMAQCRAPGGNQ